MYHWSTYICQYVLTSWTRESFVHAGATGPTSPKDKGPVQQRTLVLLQLYLRILVDAILQTAATGIAS